MTEGADPIHEAVEYLRARGRRVSSDAEDAGLWHVDDEDSLTAVQVVALALGLGLLDARRPL